MLTIYQLHFSQFVHFGKGSLEQTEVTFHADTLFSALFLAAMEEGREKEFLQKVKEGTLLFSDGLPIIKKSVFIPTRKNYVSLFGEKKYIENELGKRIFLQKNSMQKETVPYGIEVFHFNSDCGLFLLCDFGGEGEKILFEKLMKKASQKGLGGKRNIGFGQFIFQPFFDEKTIQYFNKLYYQKSRKWKTLSVCLPKEEEFDESFSESEYSLIKRSGFTYGEEIKKKNDVYLFDAGSVFTEKFEGQILDVGKNMKHPVYRYAKPFWIGVE